MLASQSDFKIFIQMDGYLSSHLDIVRIIKVLVIRQVQYYLFSNIFICRPLLVNIIYKKLIYSQVYLQHRQHENICIQGMLMLTCCSWIFLINIRALKYKGVNYGIPYLELVFRSFWCQIRFGSEFSDSGPAMHCTATNTLSITYLIKIGFVCVTCNIVILFINRFQVTYVKLLRYKKVQVDKLYNYLFQVPRFQYAHCTQVINNTSEYVNNNIQFECILLMFNQKL